MAKRFNHRHSRSRRFGVWALGVGLVLLVYGLIVSGVGGHQQTAIAEILAKSHPLPATLAQLPDTKQQGDYFDQVRPVSVGYLVWSDWPVTLSIVPPPAGALIKSEVWQAAIAQAVRDWQPFLPLKLVDGTTHADIEISGNPPQFRSGQRVRSAETRFELYKGDRGELAHRVTIYIRPNQTPTYITAAARHELGHGLGIWGHSPNPTDVMYFAQVRVPPPISARDANTLKRIYEQPTRLGWPTVDAVQTSTP